MARSGKVFLTIKNKKVKRQALICKDCNTEIFSDTNMVMLKDAIWKKVSDSFEDAICDKCIEKRLGRNITLSDFKPSSINGVEMIPCNQFWLIYKGVELNGGQK